MYEKCGFFDYQFSFLGNGTQALYTSDPTKSADPDYLPADVPFAVYFDNFTRELVVKNPMDASVFTSDGAGDLVVVLEGRSWA